MRKVLCLLALFAAVGMLVASVSPEAPARQKDKDKKETKKADKKNAKGDGAGKVEVYQGKDGWRFRVFGSDGKLVAVGVQGYAKKEECLDAVEELKGVIGKAKVTEIPKDKKGKD